MVLVDVECIILRPLSVTAALELRILDFSEEGMRFKKYIQTYSTQASMIEF